MLGAALGIPVVLGVLTLAMERLERRLDRPAAVRGTGPADGLAIAERAPSPVEPTLRPLPAV